MRVDTLLRKEKEGTLYKSTGDHHKIAKSAMVISLVKAAFLDELGKIAEETAPKAKPVYQAIVKKLEEADGKLAESKAHRFLEGMSEEGAGAIGMTLGAGIGNMYGHPLQGAGIGYGLGAATDWAARSLAARLKKGK